MGTGRAYVYADSPSGLGSTPLVTLSIPSEHGAEFGVSVAAGEHFGSSMAF